LAVKAVILDLDGTLINGTTPVAEVPEMMAALRDAGLRIAVASNREDGRARLKRSGLNYDLFLDKTNVGVGKGSPRWVDRVSEAFDVQRNELVWLGDGDNDMRSAVNGSVIYFHAAWSVPRYPYGVMLKAPGLFPLMLNECFRKPVNWYWTLSASDRAGRQITSRAMIDGNGAGIPALRNDLLSFLKDGGNPRVGKFTVRDLMIVHLIGSIYGEGLFRSTDLWAVYPGSKGGTNKSLELFAKFASRLFKDRYIPDLLIRHTPSMDSGLSRRRGVAVTFTNQVNTVNLNKEVGRRLEGKVIALVDDFTTRGYSSECARNLFVQAGAKEVISISMGKYGPRQSIVSPIRGYAWDPFAPATHSDDKFDEIVMTGSSKSSALDVVRESYQRLSSS
jgi:hypothetical protein